MSGTTSIWNVTAFSVNNALSNESNTSSNLTYAPVYELAYQSIGLCLYISVFIIGILGNIMVITVVIKSTAMHTTTNCYLVSLASADIFVLIASITPNLVELVTYQHNWIFGPVGCSIFVFLQYLGINSSSLSITAFTVERYIAIGHPMRAQTICTISRAKKIIFFIWFFSVIYCSPWLILTKVTKKNFLNDIIIEYCTFKLARSTYKYYYMADLLLFYIHPLILTIVLYSLIARILYRSLSSNFGGKVNGTSSKNSKSSVNSNRVQVVKMLAVVVALFAILWIPYRFMVVYNSYAKKKFESLWYLLFAREMVFINSAINPILYNAMSVKFRREFKKATGCADSHPHPNYTNYMSHSAETEHIKLKLVQKNSPLLSKNIEEHV